LAPGAHAGQAPWIFLDILLPDDPRNELMAWLGAQGWADRTILMSADVTKPVIHQSLLQGFRGFIPKSATPEQIIEGFETVRQGSIYLPEAMRLTLGAQPIETLSKGLSPRLLQVRDLVLRGTPNKLIAAELNLSEHTVKEYIGSILAFHGVKNRLELILKYYNAASPSKS
jgi:two-component system, NarL family, nitrate/nitrite response regulator NarL